jgi:hypothetical protein
MVTDKNKEIATIAYNHFNLPVKVTKTHGQYVKYISTAAGVKLSQKFTMHPYAEKENRLCR